jgi:hypothetical protein
MTKTVQSHTSSHALEREVAAEAKGHDDAAQVLGGQQQVEA